MTRLPNLSQVPHLPDVSTVDGVLIPKGIGPATLRKLRGMDTATLHAVLSSQQIGALHPEVMAPREVELDHLVFRNYRLPFKAVCIAEGECGEGGTELIVVCPICRTEASTATAGDRCGSHDRGDPPCLEVFVQVQCRNPGCGKTSTMAIGTDECGRATVGVYTSEGGEK